MSTPMEKKEPVLRVEHLTTSFRTDRGVVTAVDDVSFDVHAGETLGIVGESGCGKTVTSKSISKAGGRSSYRGLLEVAPGAHGSKSQVECDALILDEASRSDTYPYMEIEEADAQIGHEATVSKVGEEQLFYLRSRGLSEEEATAMIVAGFVEPIMKELPMEYAVEMNRLIELQMIGSVG